MLHAKLVRENFRVNVKVVERIYREERLWLRRTKRKKIPREGREGAWCPIAPNQRWSLDFTSDALANGRKFRTANLKDDFGICVGNPDQAMRRAGSETQSSGREGAGSVKGMVRGFLAGVGGDDQGLWQCALCHAQRGFVSQPSGNRAGEPPPLQKVAVSNICAAARKRREQRIASAKDQPGRTKLLDCRA